MPMPCRMSAALTIFTTLPLDFFENVQISFKVSHNYFSKIAKNRSKTLDKAIRLCYTNIRIKKGEKEMNAIAHIKGSATKVSAIIITLDKPRERYIKVKEDWEVKEDGAARNGRQMRIFTDIGEAKMEIANLKNLGYIVLTGEFFVEK